MRSARMTLGRAVAAAIRIESFDRVCDEERKLDNFLKVIDHDRHVIGIDFAGRAVRLTELNVLPLVSVAICV